MRIKVLGLSGLFVLLIMSGQSGAKENWQSEKGELTEIEALSTVDEANIALLAQLDEDSEWQEKEAEDKYREQLDKQCGREQFRGREDVVKKRRYLEQLRLLKLLELLDLEEDQEMRFLRDFKNFRKGLRKAGLERKRKIELLARLARKKEVRRKECLNAIDAVVAIERERLELKERFTSEALEYLTPVQMARLIVFREKFEYEMLGQLRAFREGRARGMESRRRGGKR